MSDFISEFERDMAESGDNYNIVVEDLGCKGLSDIRFWGGRMEEIFSRYDIKNLRAVILLGQEAWLRFSRVKNSTWRRLSSAVLPAPTAS